MESKKSRRVYEVMLCMSCVPTMARRMSWNIAQHKEKMRIGMRGGKGIATFAPSKESAVLNQNSLRKSLLELEVVSRSNKLFPCGRFEEFVTGRQFLSFGSSWHRTQLVKSFILANSQNNLKPKQTLAKPRQNQVNPSITLDTCLTNGEMISSVRNIGIWCQK